MRILGLIALAACAWGADEPRVTVDNVVATVRASLRKKGRDRELADALGKLTLSQHLDDRVLEIMESEGAGPQTLGALQRMRDGSMLLSAPPDPPPGMEPPPPPASAEEQEVWTVTAAKAVDYAKSLPDFICTEAVHRWQAPENDEVWTPSPTVAAELRYADHKENYKLISLDGQPSTKSLAEVGGAISRGEFGSMLTAIFDPAHKADYRWDHWTILRKRPTYVFFFRVSAAYAPNRIYVGKSAEEGVTLMTGEHGWVYIDRETRSVMRISQEAEGIPQGFPVKKSSAVLDYDYANVGGVRYLLPLRAEVRILAANIRSLNAVEFLGYRKFSSNAAAQFDAPALKK